MGLKEAGLRGSLRSVSTGVPAIPDSEANQKLIHRYALDDVNGSVEDLIGSATGQNNGVASVAGDWVGDSAGEGNAETDAHIAVDWPNFGSSMSNDFAVALSFSSGEVLGSENFIGGDNGSTSDTVFSLTRRPEGELRFRLVDSLGDEITIETDGESVGDNAPHRVVFNKTANSASGLEIWTDKSQATTVDIADGNFSDPENFTSELGMFAYLRGDSVFSAYDFIIDDVCVFDDSLTQTEIESYDNPWT